MAAQDKTRGFIDLAGPRASDREIFRLLILNARLAIRFGEAEALVMTRPIAFLTGSVGFDVAYAVLRSVRRAAKRRGYTKEELAAHLHHAVAVFDQHDALPTRRIFSRVRQFRAAPRSGK